MDIQANVKFVFQAAALSSIVISVYTGIYLQLVFIAAGLFIVYTVFQSGKKLKEISSNKELNEFKTIIDAKSQDDLVENLQQIAQIVEKTRESEGNTMVQIAKDRAQLIVNKSKQEEELQRFRHRHLENQVALSEQEKDDLVNRKCNELISKVNTETARKVQETKAQNEQKLAEIKARVDRQRQANADRMNAAVASSNSELNYARNRYRL